MDFTDEYSIGQIFKNNESKKWYFCIPLVSTLPLCLFTCPLFLHHRWCLLALRKVCMPWTSSRTLWSTSQAWALSFRSTSWKSMISCWWSRVSMALMTWHIHETYTRFLETSCLNSLLYIYDTMEFVPVNLVPSHWLKVKYDQSTSHLCFTSRKWEGAVSTGNQEAKADVVPVSSSGPVRSCPIHIWNCQRLPSFCCGQGRPSTCRNICHYVILWYWYILIHLAIPKRLWCLFQNMHILVFEKWHHLFLIFKL